LPQSTRISPIEERRHDILRIHELSTASFILTAALGTVALAQQPAQQTPPTGGPEAVRTEITVSESVSAESPAAITVVGAQSLQRMPGVNLDDRLRLVPGFTLLRRSSSLAANPTTQGISLRGIGSSGASRTLVLLDGMPLNDPFGGWVYWTRAAVDQVDRVEISRGATVSLFGDRAMGGTIHLLSRPPDSDQFSLGLEGGNAGTVMPQASYSTRVANRLGVTAGVRAFSTDGFFIVPQSIRGRVDQPANVRFVAPRIKLDYLGNTTRAHLKSDLLIEERGNGTGLTPNDTSLGSISAGLSREPLSVMIFHQRQEYRAGFSALSADRQTERQTIRQSVPSEATGGSAFGAGRWGTASFAGGGDFLRVEGYSRDWLVPSGARIGGGTQFQRGVFGQGDIKLGALRLFGGSRYHWTGTTGFYSPSGGFSVGRRQLRARGSVYRSFRAPTLNELYREFRAGNTATLPNAGLRPEALFGAEAGADAVLERTRIGVTLYRNELTDLIGNVTLQATPALITRQRRNIASAISRGLEVDLRHQWRSWSLESSYLFADSRFSTRERVPQVARHQGSAQLTWQGRGTLMSGGLRSTSLQFEDDRNTQLLPGYAVFHAAIRQELRLGLVATAVLENAFDRVYLSGFTPAPQIAAPRLWRLGLQWQGQLRK
jgi:outer membrane cobalamin receptor